MTQAMIYGATGYTGRLIARHARERGMRPILAGRDAAGVEAIARELGLPHRAFALDDAERTLAGLADVGVVLNAAGPFVATAGPMVDACVAAGAHYCDITGEIEVFEALAARDAEASEAGIVLLPGVGFDVVPSDCLLAHVAGRLDGARRVRISIGGSAQVSRGTAKTIVGMAHKGTAVRRDGRLVWETKPSRSTADFGDGSVTTVGVSYGDVATAPFSTGAADVEAFMQVADWMAHAAAMPRPLAALIGSAPVQSLLKGAIDAVLPAGPSEERRRGAGMVLLAEAWSATGEGAASRLHTPEPYGLTALTATEAMRRLLEGDVRPGFRTPATAFGPEFAMGFDGVRLEDM